jgi:NADH dehydrogenase
VGSVASLGLHKGVAQVYGVKLRGFPAWFMHRTYHMSRVPTFNRKVRVVLDWTLALLFKREVVSLGSLENPRGEFSEAVR